MSAIKESAIHQKEVFYKGGTRKDQKTIFYDAGKILKANFFVVFWCLCNVAQAKYAARVFNILLLSALFTNYWLC